VPEYRFKSTHLKIVDVRILEYIAVHEDIIARGDIVFVLTVVVRARHEVAPTAAKLGQAALALLATQRRRQIVCFAGLKRVLRGRTRPSRPTLRQFRVCDLFEARWHKTPPTGATKLRARQHNDEREGLELKSRVQA
jgi:hypothetical protein